MNKKLINWWIGSSQTDSDAEAFFTAAGITDATQKSAVTTLVIGLKANSLWTPMRAIYPFVGGTSTTHAYNLKDPRNLDAAFRLTYSGTVSHSSTGMHGNGTNGYAITYFRPLAEGFTSSNACIGIYSRTDSAATIRDMGISDGGLNIATFIQCKWSDNKAYAGTGSTAFPCNVAVADAFGFYVVSRVSATNTSLYKNGALIKNVADTSVAVNHTGGIFICALNQNGGPINYSNREYSFAFISSSLTDANVSALNTIVQAYQTTLGRNV